MKKQIKKTLTFLFALLFGGLASALVNILTYNNSVHWSECYTHPEFYILSVLGLITLYLTLESGRTEAEEQYSRDAKIDAIYAQICPAIVTQNALTTAPQSAVQFTEKGQKGFAQQSAGVQAKITQLLEWLIRAKPSEIARNPNIKKSSSSDPLEFIARVGNCRVLLEFDIQAKSIKVNEVFEKK